MVCLYSFYFFHYWLFNEFNYNTIMLDIMVSSSTSLQNMIVLKWSKMSACNLQDIMHKNWLQQFGNKMSLWNYHGIIDLSLHANCQLQSMVERGVPHVKDQTKHHEILKGFFYCGNPKVLVDAMKSYPKVIDLNARDHALEGSKLLNPPSTNLIFLLWLPFLNKVNSIIHPNIDSTWACIEEL